MRLLWILVVGIWCFPAGAENAVVLESFEDGINSATLATNPGGRPSMTPPGVALSAYTKQNSTDLHVTDGKKSLKVVLSGRKKHSVDFQIKLSDDASAKVRAAAASKDFARYLLRYDVIFPPLGDFVYFNSGLQLGDCRDVLISAGGKRTMSVALDLLTGLPPGGPLTLIISDDFDLKPEFTNVTIYVDNIRLLDTYAPGAQPIVHVLQSFERNDEPLGGVSHFTEWDDGKANVRTVFAQYTAADAKDLRVTEGRHALEVTTAAPGMWHADFILPFDKTKLAEVLKLDKSEAERPARQDLARYTLRWDVTYPDLNGEWMNSTYHTIDTFLPIIQVRQNKSTNQRLTYSVTLDQTEWGSFMDVAPQLIFITEGPQKTQNIKVYYDNFRLIDTGHVPSLNAKNAQAATGSAGD